MAKAHVDPAELRRFAKDLKRFNSEMEVLISGIHSRMQGLEKTWQDQEQHKFSEQFEQTMKSLSRFLETSNEHVLFLTRKAHHIEDYLQQH